jgi:hypothetical protein
MSEPFSSGAFAWESRAACADAARLCSAADMSMVVNLSGFL